MPLNNSKSTYRGPGRPPKGKHKVRYKTPVLAECAWEKCTRGPDGTRGTFLKKTKNNKFCHIDCRYAHTIKKDAERKRRNRKTRKKCSVPGCNNPRGKGLMFLCDMHYRTENDDEFYNLHI